MVTYTNEELVRAYMNGVAIKDIAEKSGVSVQVIYERIKKT